MEFRLVVKIDNGETITGCTVCGGEEDFQKLKEVLAQVNDLEYLHFDIPNGHVYMPRSLIQRSYFKIEILG